MYGGERLRQIGVPILAAGAVGGATLAAVEQAGAWKFDVKAEAVVPQCPTDAPTQPILTVENGESVRYDRSTDYTVDGTIDGVDVDYQVKQEDGTFGPVQESFLVPAKDTTTVRIVADFKAGQVYNGVLSWKASKTKHPFTETIVELPGAPCPPAETPETTTPQPTPEETPDQTVVPTPTPEPTTPKAPKKPKDNPSRIDVTKQDITYNGKVYVASNGERMGRVSPGEVFTTKVTARALNDGDRIKREVERTKVVIKFPKAQNGQPGQYGYDPIKKKWVRSITRTVNLVEGGKPKVWKFRTKNTEDAAKPPQVLCNTVTAWSEGRKKDTAEDCIFDPKEMALMARRDQETGRYVITVKEK